MRDQRTMVGTMRLTTAKEVVEAWFAFVTSPNFPGFVDGRQGPDLLKMDTPVSAYVSEDRWVADCPNPRCNGGIACWPEHERACCLDCGRIYPVVFPSKRDIKQAEMVLQQRSPNNRNWFPHQGETVRNLAAENVANNLDVIVPAEELI